MVKEKTCDTKMEAIATTADVMVTPGTEWYGFLRENNDLKPDVLYQALQYETQYVHTMHARNEQKHWKLYHCVFDT